MTTPRRCGHCRDIGHNITTCEVLIELINGIYHTVMNILQYDISNNKNGYYFEKWVRDELTPENLKYLVLKITNYSRSSSIHIYNTSYSLNIIFEYFASLDIGYISPSIRKARIYHNVYQEVQRDVENEGNGNHLETYLKTLSPDEIDDLYSQIHLQDNNPSEREFEFWYSQPGLMCYKHFAIHCHYAGFSLSNYDFRIRNIAGYQERESRFRNPNRNPNPIERSTERERNRINRIVPSYRFIDDTILEINGNLYTFTKEDKVESELIKECTICMESKQYTEFFTTECNHTFCNMCIGQLLMKSKLKCMSCPLCRHPVKEFTVANDTNFSLIFSSSIN